MQQIHLARHILKAVHLNSEGPMIYIFFSLKLRFSDPQVEIKISAAALEGKNQVLTHAKLNLISMAEKRCNNLHI